VPVRELAQWIREQLTLMLDEVPFEKEDPTFLPDAGPRSAFQKRTGFNRALWDDFKDDRCLDAQCYNRRLLEAAVLSMSDASMDFNVLLKSPSLFPFQINRIFPEQLTQSGRLEIVRHGLQEVLVQLRSTRANKVAL
jgi:hypothetical protein